MTKNENIKSEFTENGFIIPCPDDPFEMKSGPFYVAQGNDGATVVSIRVGRDQCNKNLVAHGGLLMTLADLAVCHEAVQGTEYTNPLTISLTANFLMPAKEGTLLRAFPKLNHRTKRMGFLEATILADDECVFTCTSIIRVMMGN
jgi:uncharacterized protein (TIGR00369 family)